ncbi:MAG: MBL fold metallo-hydrolase, partial [Caloramator sp.]|nr:MBL fold metallo-hydrolase [Caloramator sp.]
MKRFFTAILAFIFILSFSGCFEVGVDNRIDNQLMVSVLDVGQGDAILVKTPKGKFILVDSGPNAQREEFEKKLKKNGVDRFEVVIATHPHEDHIGNMDDVFRNFDVSNIYMPKVVTTTKTFQNMMNEIKNKNLKIKTAKAGIKFNLDGVDFEFLAPNSDSYESLNNYSVVVKITYGKNKFLLMGDAEKLSEEEILNKGFDVSADVIKIGHHGSYTATSENLIKKVNPTVAVLSLGKDNPFG